MARRARFGRTPRVQPNLSSTLVSIAHEMVARQDANIMDAWKNGGEFEGKKVTDEMVQAYWKKRQSGLDKNDPLYDTYQDQIMQLQYGIEQSKADLAHVQGKMSDGAYAQFFLKWSKKAPKNSEWWRTLQKDAAQLLAQAKEKARVNSNKQKQDAFNAFVKDQNKDISVGTALTDALGQLSKDTGLDLEANGDELLSKLTQDYKANPDKYHALADALKAGAPEFGGTFTKAFVSTSIDNSVHAYDRVATRANHDGYAQAYAGATKGQADMHAWVQDLNVWPVAKQYDSIMSVFNKTFNNPSASIADKQQAAAVASAAISGIIDKNKDIDIGSKTMLQADADRLLGKPGGDAPSFGVAMLNHPGVDDKVAGTIQYATVAQQTMDANPGAYVYAPTDAKGQFDPTGQGSVGIVPAAAIPANAKFVAVPGLNGTAHMVAVQPRTLVADDPNDPNGQPINLNAQVITYAVGGTTVSMYGYADSKGVGHWSLSSPLADGAQTYEGKDGNTHVILPQQGAGGATDPAARAAQIEARYPGLGLTDAMKNYVPGGKISVSQYERQDVKTVSGSGAVGKDSKPVGKVTVEYDGTNFVVKTSQLGYDTKGNEIETNTVTQPWGVVDPKFIAQTAFSPDRLAGGNIPGITFDSAAEASVAASQSNMSQQQVATLSQDPAFQHAFTYQTMQTLGITNPADPRVQQAWTRATSRANAVPEAGSIIPGTNGMTVSPTFAGSRTDLTYPGSAAAVDPTKSQVSINFNGKELTLPNVPAYLAGGGNADALKASYGGAYGPFQPGSLFSQQIAPGQLPGVKPGVTPPPSGFTPTAMTPTAAPPTMTPTATTPTSAPPTSAPPPSSGPGGGPGRGPHKE